MPRNHFDISENSQDYDYSSRVTYFGGGNPIPQRDRAAHAQHVAAMFLAAKEADRHYRDSAHVDEVRDGYYLKIQNQLPLLAKIIDARRDLSIQVHPNDEMAQREHGKMGKSEMWYILDAKPGASLYAGFRQNITPEEYKERVANGTITEVLAKHEVNKGDVFYLPAGRVHAICGGIRLAEIQQSSDVTYRIYDYNRPGLDGQPRELHTELAAQAIDYTVYPEYKTEHRDDIDVAHKILNTPFFSVKVIEASDSFHRNMMKYDSFIIVMNLKGDCRLRIRSTQHTILLQEGASCLIPAAIADYDYIPVGSTTKVLEAFINNYKTIGQLISDFLRLK